MIRAASCVAALPILLTLASASAGASGARPPVALTASPAHVDLAGSGRATVRVKNSGTSRVVLDVRRAGFALDLRGRPQIVGGGEVARSSAGWLAFRPRSLVLNPGAAGSVSIVSKVPARAEPGDHDALVLFTTRRRASDGLAVRVRMGVVVVVRAPGTIVRRFRLGGVRVTPSGRRRILEVAIANRGNVTESISRARAMLSVHRAGRRLAKVAADPRTFRPGTTGLLQFRYRGPRIGAAIARVHVVTDSGQVLRRAFRIRL